MKIGNQTEATMQATLTTAAAFPRRRTRDAGLRLHARTALKRLQATIVNGSDHPCWGQADAGSDLRLPR